VPRVPARISDFASICPEGPGRSRGARTCRVRSKQLVIWTVSDAHAVRARFAPDANSVAQLQQWLRSQGFSVQYTPQNNHYVSAEGTVAQAQAAFGTSFGNYLVKGQTLRSPTADISVPSSFASIVTSVVALDESFQFVQTYHKVDGNAPPSAGFRNSPPLSIFWAQLLSPYAFPAGFTDLAFTPYPGR